MRHNYSIQGTCALLLEREPFLFALVIGHGSETALKSLLLFFELLALLLQSLFEVLVAGIELDGG